MKILFIAPLDSIHSKRWIEFFSRREDMEVQVLCFGKQVLPIEKATVHALGEEGASWKSFKGIIQRLKAQGFRRRMVRQLKTAFRPDIIHIHWIHAPAIWAARRFRAPIVATAWGSDVLIHTKKSLLQRRAVKETLKISKCVTCDAVHLKERMIAFGGKAEKIKLIYFGTNCEEYSPANRDPDLAVRLGWAKVGSHRDQFASAQADLRCRDPGQGGSSRHQGGPPNAFRDCRRWRTERLPAATLQRSAHRAGGPFRRAPKRRRHETVRGVG